MQDFAKLILKNLEANGFPGKKVSLPTEKMYEKADEKGLSLNQVLDYMRTEYLVDNTIEVEKIIFSPLKEQDQAQGPFAGMDSAEMMKKAQELMSQMDPGELKKIQEQFQSMSESEKADLMQKGRDMGII